MNGERKRAPERVGEASRRDWPHVADRVGQWLVAWSVGLAPKGGEFVPRSEQVQEANIFG